MIDDWKSGDCPRVTANPNQGGYDAGSIESDGTPGDKEVGFGALGMPMNGNFNEQQMNAFSGTMGRPEAAGIPDMMDAGFTPSGDGMNPTAGEGGTGPADYPRRGLLRY